MRILLSSVAAFLVFAPPAWGREQFHLMTEEFPPYNMTKDGRIAGAATELVRAIFQRASIPYRMEMLPWARGYYVAQKEANACLFSTSKTQDRKFLFEWIGPLAADKFALFAKAGRKLGIKTMNDVKHWTIGSYPKSGLATTLESMGFKIDYVASNDQNPARLMDGGIDLWAATLIGGPAIAHSQGIDEIEPVITFLDVEMSLACNKKSDPDALAALREALAEIRRQ